MNIETKVENVESVSVTKKIGKKEYSYFAEFKDGSSELLRKSARLYGTCHLHMTRCGSAGTRDTYQDRLGNFFTFGNSPSPYVMLKKTFEIDKLFPIV